MDRTERSSDGENVRASVKLLDKFQSQWEEIHCSSVNNVEKAKVVMAKINKIDQSCTQRSMALNSFIQGYKSLNELNTQIDTINCDIENLEKYFTQLEDCLLQLKVHKEKRAAEDYINKVEAEYEAQVRDHRVMSEVNKDRLMTEHLERVQAFDKEQLRLLEEKRLILDKEFQEDKNRYLANKSSRT